MTSDKPIFHYVRVVLEAVTPHGIQSGRGDATHDVLLVRDCNNLPALPATSIAGVLRHLYTQEYGEACANQVFGFMQGDSGSPSSIQFTWGLIHDQNNRPVEGIRDDVQQDDLLQALCHQKPIVRQRVKLNARGSAVDTGKYDITLVPAGARYSCFMSLWSDGSEQQEFSMENLLKQLTHPLFRLGHGTRSGQGAFRVEALHCARWDLRTKEGRQGFINRPRSRAETGELKSVKLTETQHQLLTCKLNLTAESGWRIGGGELAFSNPDEQGRSPDLLPQSEQRIQWVNGKAQLRNQQAVLPASALKGTLAHRTAYHWRRLEEDWVNEASSDLLPEPLYSLFGCANNDTSETGQAGNIIIDDLYIDNPQAYTQMHNKIDHFTGGVIKGALFEEELFWKTPIALSMQIKDADKLPANAIKALALSLEDLTQGWLPIGSGGSRGQGTFTGTLSWLNAESIDLVTEAL